MLFFFQLSDLFFIHIRLHYQQVMAAGLNLESISDDTKDDRKSVS